MNLMLYGLDSDPEAAGIHYGDTLGQEGEALCKQGEPCWTHAKKAIMEIDRKLTAAEITHRVCEHFGCELLPYLKIDSAGDGALNSSAL